MRLHIIFEPLPIDACSFGCHTDFFGTELALDLHQRIVKRLVLSLIFCRKGATGGFDGGLAKDRPVLEYDANSAIFLCECGQPWVHLAAEGTLIIGKNHQCEVIYFGLTSPRRRKIGRASGREREW